MNIRSYLFMPNKNTIINVVVMEIKLVCTIAIKLVSKY